MYSENAIERIVPSQAENDIAVALKIIREEEGLNSDSVEMVKDHLRSVAEMLPQLQHAGIKVCVEKAIEKGGYIKITAQKGNEHHTLYEARLEDENLIDMSHHNSQTIRERSKKLLEG